MTLGIVIPLKSKQTSRDWEVTSDALQQCLNSIIRQSSNNFSVAVCGHDKPNFLNSSKYTNVKFLESHFTPPDRKHPKFSHQHLIRDKNLKIGLAIKVLQNEDIDYWYQLDSDDLLHKDFIKIVQASLNCKAGAVIDGGYMLYANQKRAVATEEMTQYCGSTSIISNQYMTVPDDINENSISHIPWARYSHMTMRHFFETELNKSYAIINDKILGYVLATGDNISDRWRDSPIKALKALIKPYLKGQKLSLAIKNNFGIYP